MIKLGENRIDEILTFNQMGCIVLDIEETIWRERKGIFDKIKTWIK